MIQIKELLRQKGMTAKDLAAKMNISEGALSKSLSGNQTLERLSQIATALNVPISSLFEAERDFIAFVRRNGETFTFETEDALKAYAETLPVSDRTNKKED